MSQHLTYLEAVVTGLVQGVTELFPVSSLGHNVLIPALIGGSWASTLNVSAKDSPYLAFIVGLHVATAIAMIAYFWRDWLRIVGGFVSSIRTRSVKTPDERLAWIIILATIPVGIVGAGLQKVLISVFARPELAAVFLAVNGVILLLSERMRRSREAAGRTATVPVASGAAPRPQGPQGPQGYPQRPQGPQQPWPEPQQPWQQQPRQQQGQGPDPRARGRHAAAQPLAGAGTDPAVAADRRLSGIGYKQAVIIGSAQILALLPGISRDGIVTVAGMGRGLKRQDAVRFSFLLSAPVILAAGALKAKDLTGPLSAGIHGPILVGSLISGIGAYLSIRFLTKYFSEEKSLSPFGIYCLIAGIGSLVYLVLK